MAQPIHLETGELMPDACYRLDAQPSKFSDFNGWRPEHYGIMQKILHTQVPGAPVPPCIGWLFDTLCEPTSELYYFRH
jgi:hypothetical protein